MGCREGGVMVLSTKHACIVQGVPGQETRVTCTACAGTLLLEFGLLSRLTQNPVYEEAARNAAVQVYGKPRAAILKAWLQ
jgi:hypothetical protein